MRRPLLLSVLALPSMFAACSAKPPPPAPPPAPSASAPVASASAPSAEPPPPPPLPQAVAAPGPLLCAWSQPVLQSMRAGGSLEEGGAPGGLRLKGSVNGKPFAVLYGGQAKVQAVEGKERLALVDMLSPHLHLGGLTSLDELSLHLARPFAFAGVYTPDAGVALRWGGVVDGRVVATARAPAPLIAKAPLEARLGCDDVAIAQARYHLEPAPDSAKLVFLRPGRTVGFSAEPGGAVAVEVRIPAPPRPSPPGKATRRPGSPRDEDGVGEAVAFGGLRSPEQIAYETPLIVEETRGKHVRVRWQFREGTLRAWVPVVDTRPLTAKEEKEAKGGFGVIGGVGHGFGHGSGRKTIPGALAVCEQELPLIIETEDESLLAGHVRPNTCIDVLLRKDPHARIRLRSHDAAFPDHVTLLARMDDLRRCKVVETKDVQDARDVPEACLETGR